MSFRVLIASIGQLILFWSLIASTVSAQTQPATNVFFGFEFVLQPIAIKWNCGGQKDQDMSQIQALITAFPKDAESAELRSIVVALSEVPEGMEGLPQLLDAELSSQQMENLCAAALSLRIDWLTPEQMISDTEKGVPPDQRAAWANFFQVVESFQ